MSDIPKFIEITDIEENMIINLNIFHITSIKEVIDSTPPTNITVITLINGKDIKTHMKFDLIRKVINGLFH